MSGSGEAMLTGKILISKRIPRRPAQHRTLSKIMPDLVKALDGVKRLDLVKGILLLLKFTSEYAFNRLSNPQNRFHLVGSL